MSGGVGTSVADRSGDVLGDKYQLVRRIGSGGMGAVYEAIQSDLGRRVAVKILHPHLSLEPTLLERFRREALAAAALGHPNIVSVSDFQSPEGAPPFLVMELLTGSSLKQAIAASGVFEARRAVHVAAQVLSALGAAHAERVLHRDVKPDNIVLIDTSAMRDFVKVLDFGVAKLQGDKVVGLTVAGAILGTLSYMAPEQARGDALDGRADVYSVGACLYHALAGKKPFERKSRAELYAAVILEPPPPLAALRPDLDPELVALVERAMAKKQGERFSGAEEMVHALVSWQSKRGGPPSLPAPGSMRSPSLVPVIPSAPSRLPSVAATPPPRPVLAQVEHTSISASAPDRTSPALAFHRIPLPVVIVASLLVGLLLERALSMFLAQ